MKARLPADDLAQERENKSRLATRALFFFFLAGMKLLRSLGIAKKRKPPIMMRPDLICKRQGDPRGLSDAAPWSWLAVDVPLPSWAAVGEVTGSLCAEVSTSVQ